MYPSNQLDPGSCPFLVSTIRSFVVLLIDLSCWLRSSHLLRFSVFIFFSFQFNRCAIFFFLYQVCTTNHPNPSGLARNPWKKYVSRDKISVDLRSRATFLLSYLDDVVIALFCRFDTDLECLWYRSADGSYKICRPGMQIKRHAGFMYYAEIRFTESH